MEGHAAFILHYKGDTLFQLGDQEDKEVVWDGKVKEKPKEAEEKEPQEKIEKEDEEDDAEDFMAFG